MECVDDLHLLSAAGEITVHIRLLTIVTKLEFELGKFREVPCPGVYLGTLET